MTNKTRFGACVILLNAVTSVTWAQSLSVADGLSAPKTASTGSTEVASAGFEAVGKERSTSANDTTTAKLAFGALASTGNSRSLASTGAGTFRLRREMNQLSIAAAVNYAKSRPADEERMQTTVENYQGKVRFDRFVAEHLALFASVSTRKDRFQGLDIRLNLDPGIAYYFIDEKPTQFWTELGYDYQYDVRTRKAVREANALMVDGNDRLTRKQDRHSGRVFLGYVTAFNDKVALTSGVEYLAALVATENWRLFSDVGVSASLLNKLSLAMTFTVRYDHHPLPKIEKVDTTESVSLVYTLL